MENLTWNSWKWKQLTPHEPVNTHGHTYSQAQWHSFAPPSWSREYQKTLSFNICFTKSRHKKNPTSQEIATTWQKTIMQACLFLIYYWKQKCQCKPNQGHSTLASGGLVCKISKFVIWKVWFLDPKTLYLCVYLWGYTYVLHSPTQIASHTVAETQSHCNTVNHTLTLSNGHKCASSLQSSSRLCFSSRETDSLRVGAHGWLAPTPLSSCQSVPLVPPDPPSHKGRSHHGLQFEGVVTLQPHFAQGYVT